MKRIILKLLKGIITFLTSIYEKSSSLKNDSKYNSLSPTNNAKDVKHYLEALKWALDNRSKNKNIAITGAYGSGKSSILKTFQKEQQFNNNYKFVNISLANFKNENNKTPDVDQRLIELSILQQLFYYEKNSKIPLSRFKRLSNHSFIKTFIISCLIVIYGVTFLFLKFPDWIKEFTVVKITETNMEWVHPLSVLIIILGTLYLVFKIIVVLKSLSIKNIEVGSAQIEIDKEESKSILNHYLDEIIYFFEATNNNIVILEDIDRFDQNEIFTKLREINLIINSSKKVVQDVVFIYAIKDDMFQNKDRTKFFDYIIPIIPVISSNNSEAKLIDRRDNMKLSISDELISDISLFIDDMRLLVNIFNEYKLYSKNLSDNLDQNKLFSMIVYKNISPADFLKLGENSGSLYEIINIKSTHIQKIENSINIEIAKKNQSIRNLENQFPKKVEDLRRIYISKILDKVHSKAQPFYGLVIDEQIYNSIKLYSDSIFEKVKNLNTIEYVNTNNIRNRISLGISFKSLEAEINPDLSYEEYENNILKDKEIIEKYREEKLQLENERSTLHKLLLKDLITDYNLELSDELKDKRILNILIRNGYIDENYRDYISIFHEGSLMRTDYEFVINVKTQTYSEFELKLIKFNKILSKISKSEFEQNYILNYSLLDFLLLNNQFEHQLRTFLHILKNKSDKSWEFVDGYINRNKNISRFIYLLSKQWDDIFHDYYYRFIQSEEKTDQFLRLLLTHADVDSICKHFKHYENFILNNYAFLKNYEDENKLKEIISGLDLKFIDIEQSVPESLFKFILQGNYYDISLFPVAFLLNINDEKSDFYKQNYTSIMESNLKPMKNYINNNINLYLENVYFRLKSNRREKNNYIISLLNNKDVKADYKVQIVQMTDTIITDLDQIAETSVINLLLEYDKITASWDNLIIAFKRNDKILTEDIKRTIASQTKKDFIYLTNIELPKSDNEEEVFNIKDFCTSLIKNDDFNDELYKVVILAIPYTYKSLDFSMLSLDKVAILIKAYKLNLTQVNLENLKELYPELITSFFEVFKNELYRRVEDSEVELSNDDINNILLSEVIGFSTKKQIIEHYTVDTFISSKLLQRSLGKLILKERKYNFDSAILKSIILKSDLSDEERIEIFNTNNHLLDILEIKNFISSLSYPLSNIAIKGKRPSIEKNQTLLEFCRILKTEKDYIQNYLPKEHKIRVITYRDN